MTHFESTYGGCAEKRGDPMRRREIIAGLACATTAWPFSAQGQRQEPVRRVGVLANTETPEEMQALLASYKGPITKIPTGKRVTRKPSKKPGQSGSLQGAWTEKQDRMVWGE